ncbi:SHOCT domain-containing protein [Isoptericola sp. b441]|uniref:SHOCT domain-containing protein n=1 Tax=Actinotalea lenta TaxID=3064654 RepID=A0ABT9D9P0_9CELL|nr:MULTISPECIES: SHOCT domain-containing protein [unclassified Isoptericola]MDO8107629.1 SHOCT domain-containing protein [Isoptericola sp. b441]MDO8120710.1 SHOCT domain-containing protein [Isoptericola sp. b490]
MSDLAGADVWTYVLWTLVLVGAATVTYVGLRSSSRAGRRLRPDTGGGRLPGRRTGPAGPELLEQRLARGEIDIDEFTSRLRALEDR